MKQLFLLLTALLTVEAANAAPLTLTATIKEVAVIARPGVDYGGVQISVVEPITGTGCTAADLASGFYYSSFTSTAVMPLIQLIHAQAIAAKAQDLKIKVFYDSASTCYPGYGVGFTGISIPYP